MTDKQTRVLRSKMLGALLRETRLDSGKSMTQLAELLGTSSSTLSSYEHGRKSFSLPELELLAYHLDIPLSRVLNPSAEDLEEGHQFDPHMMLGLRQGMIAAQLRQARHSAGYSMRELAEMIDMPVSRISAYERGLRPVPIPDLESLLNALDNTLESLIDRGGPVGAWLEEKLAFEHFRELPEDLRTFFSTPDHEPYLRMAVRLSQLDLADMRAVSDALHDLLP